MVGSYRRRLPGAAAVLALMLVLLAPPPAAVAGKSNLEICADTTCTSGPVHHFDFGPVNTSINASVDFFVHNVSSTSTNIKITSSLSGGPFSFNSYGCAGIFAIPPGQWCFDEVWFTPTSTGHFHGTYTVTGDDGSSAKTGLAGTGT